MELITAPAPPKKLIVSIAGDPKTGKSHFAFTAPGPSYYHEFDQGSWSRVSANLPAWTYEAGIHREIYPLRSQGFEHEALADKQRAAAELWTRFRRVYKESILAAAADGGKVIVDTSTLLWDTMQLAMLDYFDEGPKKGELKKGRLTYREVNAQYRGVVGYARDPAGIGKPDAGCNLFLIHHMRPIFEKNEKNQLEVVGYEPSTHREVEALVDVAVRMLRPRIPGSAAFRLRLDFCGMKPQLEGTEFDPSIDPTKQTAKLLKLDATFENVAMILGMD